MAHENNPDYMQQKSQLPLFRIVVDGMYYCGELVNNTYTFNDPFSHNSFNTVPGRKTTLEFSENCEKAKLIEGRNNLASHAKRVIDFALCGEKLPKEIKIEREPFVIPIKLNVDYFLDIQCKNSVLAMANRQYNEMINKLIYYGNDMRDRLMKECNAMPIKWDAVVKDAKNITVCETSPSDVSVTQDVLIDSETARSDENEDA